MDILIDIFRASLYIVGILILFSIIFSIITTPIREARRKKKLKKLFEELSDGIVKLSKELEEEDKGNNTNSTYTTKKPDAETYTNTTKRTRKTKEN